MKPRNLSKLERKLDSSDFGGHIDFTTREKDDVDTLTFNQLGTYKLLVEGEKHRGGFALSW